MADLDGVVGWLLANRDELQTEIEEVQSTRDWLPECSDYRVSIRFQGATLIGRSVAFSPEAALFKAACEALERIVLHEHNLYPGSGMAIHASAKKAASAAILEAIERDSVLCHHLCQIPFASITPPREIQNVSLKRLQLKLSKKGVRITFHKALACNSIQVIICRISDSSSRFISGFGAAESETDASLKALLEVIQNLPFLLGDAAGTFCSLAEFKTRTQFNPKDHGFIGLDLEYGKQQAYLFETAEPFPQPDGKLVEFECSEKSSSIIPRELELRFIEARSTRVQSYFLGPNTPQLLNLQRLKEFASPRFTFEAASPLPHFIG